MKLSRKMTASTGGAGLVLLVVNALRSYGVELTPQLSELLVVLVPLAFGYFRREPESPEVVRLRDRVKQYDAEESWRTRTTGDGFGHD